MLNKPLSESESESEKGEITYPFPNFNGGMKFGNNYNK